MQYQSCLALWVVAGVDLVFQRGVEAGVRLCVTDGRGGGIRLLICSWGVHWGVKLKVFSHLELFEVSRCNSWTEFAGTVAAREMKTGKRLCSHFITGWSVKTSEWSAPRDTAQNWASRKYIHAAIKYAMRAIILGLSSYAKHLWPLQSLPGSYFLLHVHLQLQTTNKLPAIALQLAPFLAACELVQRAHAYERRAATVGNYTALLSAW